MLITHVKPTELWGKKVFDTEGRLLGEVVAVASRHGVVRKVVVQRTDQERAVRLLPSANARIDGETLVFPNPASTGRAPRLRLVR
jgi:sporulation protein YlmC with PRC-barrel domain